MVYTGNKVAAVDVVVANISDDEEESAISDSSSMERCNLCFEVGGDLRTLCPKSANINSDFGDHLMCSLCIEKLGDSPQCLWCTGWRPERKENNVTAVVANEHHRSHTVTNLQPHVRHADQVVERTYGAKVCDFIIKYVCFGGCVAAFDFWIFSILYSMYQCLWAEITNDKKWCRYDDGEVYTIPNAILGLVITVIWVGTLMILFDKMAIVWKWFKHNCPKISGCIICLLTCE